MPCHSGFVVTNYLVVAFVVAFTIAMAWPLPGAKVLEPQVVGVHIITFINICIVVGAAGRHALRQPRDCVARRCEGWRFRLAARAA
jgi:hypothetical protein